MEKKIVQIIPCQPHTKVLYQTLNEDGAMVPALENHGSIMTTEDGETVYSVDEANVHCLALVEEQDGSRYVEPVVCVGEYLDLATGYIDCCFEEATK